MIESIIATLAYLSPLLFVLAYYLYKIFEYRRGENNNYENQQNSEGEIDVNSNFHSGVLNQFQQSVERILSESSERLLNENSRLEQTHVNSVQQSESITDDNSSGRSGSYFVKNLNIIKLKIATNLNTAIARLDPLSKDFYSIQIRIAALQQVVDSGSDRAHEAERYIAALHKIIESINIESEDLRTRNSILLDNDQEVCDDNANQFASEYIPNAEASIDYANRKAVELIRDYRIITSESDHLLTLSQLNALRCIGDIEESIAVCQRNKSELEADYRCQM